MRVDIAANIMTDLKRENEANVEYNRLTSAIVAAAVRARYNSEYLNALWDSVDALQEWKSRR